jgi:hypothetical protein
MFKYSPRASDVAAVVGAVLIGRRVAVVFSPDLKNRVRATRQGKTNSIVLTLGRPNYAERKFLRLCRKAKAQPKRPWFPGAK